MTDIDFASRVHGSLMGGALGDAFGYLIEEDSEQQIRARFGPAGLLDPSQADLQASGGSVHFSDDTQLTLYTVDALVEALEWANAGVAADETACLWLAYLRWLATQQPLPANAPVPQPRWIDSQSVLHHRRRPGKACISALSTGEMGTVGRPLNPQAKGSGTVMRSAPFGLIPYISPDMAYTLSTNGAALTHGHPSALQSAGALTWMVRSLVDGQSLAAAAHSTLRRAQTHPSPSSEVTNSLATALQAAQEPVISGEALTRRLGSGWLGHEALGLAIYCALVTEPTSSSPVAHFLAAVRLAANHSGDSDSVAAVTGNLLGAHYGEQCLPQAWLGLLEAPGLVHAVASSLLAVTSGS